MPRGLVVHRTTHKGNWSLQSGPPSAEPARWCFRLRLMRTPSLGTRLTSKTWPAVHSYRFRWCSKASALRYCWVAMVLRWCSALASLRRTLNRPPHIVCVSVCVCVCVCYASWLYFPVLYSAAYDAGLVGLCRCGVARCCQREDMDGLRCVCLCVASKLQSNPGVLPVYPWFT
jgi:hypothetical protein